MAATCAKFPSDSATLSMRYRLSAEDATVNAAWAVSATGLPQSSAPVLAAKTCSVGVPPLLFSLLDHGSHCAIGCRESGSVADEVSSIKSVVHLWKSAVYHRVISS